MYAFRCALLSVFFLLFGLSKVESQIQKVDFLIQYNPETCLYEACIVIVEGSATSYPQRIQFNSQYSIVAPTGTVLTIDTAFWPKEDNATYTGTIPCQWDFGPQEISPPDQPESDFYSVIPNISPPSAFDNLMVGDTVRLFGLSTNAPLECETALRPFITGSDPNSGQMPGGGDFTCGYTIGSGLQLYRQNLETVHPPLPEINWDIDCSGDITINVSPMDSLMCQHPYGIVWTGPAGSGFFSTDISPMIPEPVMPGLYEAFITDSYGCDTTIFIQVDGVPPVTSSQVICGAGTVTLEDLSGSGTGTWTLDPANTTGAFVGITTSGTATATFFANATGLYTFIYSGSACDAITEITVAASTDVPTVSNNGPLCVGQDLMLTTDPVAGATYAWTGPNSFTSSDQNPIIIGITGAEAGDYELVVTSGGCSSSPALTTVVVNNPPSTPTANSNSPICDGDDIMLTTDLVAGATYSWTGPNSFTSTDQNPIISGATTAATGSYCVTIIVDGCESTPGCTNVTVDMTPVIPIATNNGPICDGEDILLSTDAVAGATYAWTGPNSFTSSDQEPIITNASSINVGQYCVVITNNGCDSDPGCTDVSLKPTPPAPIVNNNGPLCEDETLNLTADPVAGATYSWTGPNSFTSSDQNPTINNVTSLDAGDYCLTLIVDGCESTSECTTVVIEDKPLNPVVSNNGLSCSGGDLQLFVDPIAGASYAWTGPNSFASSDQNPIILNATSADQGQYCVTITVDGCDSDPGCTDVVINDTPITPVVSSNSELCEGETLLLEGPTITGATYSWRDPNNFEFSFDEDPIIANITVAEAGMYCLMVTVNGCVSEAGCTDVVVNPKPVKPNVFSNSPICPGDTIRLYTDEVVGATYLWEGPTGIFFTDEDPVIGGPPAIPGTYCLVVTLDGCESDTSCVDILLKMNPPAPNISSNTPLCEGSELMLTADLIPGAIYEWTGPNGFMSSDQNPTLSNITLANAGTYFLTVVLDGCSSPSISTNVTIFPTPLEPTPTGNGPICEGEDIMLAVETVAGANYIWSGPNGFISFQQNPVISGATASESGSYCVVISLGGCDSTPGCVDVIVNPIPAAPTATNNGPICEGEDITLMTDAVTNATYAWTGPNSFLSADQNPVIIGATTAESGSYCVIVTVEGCESLEGCTNVLVNPIPATPIAVNNGPICEGEDIILSTDAVTNATYSWTGPNSFVSTDQNPVISGATTSESGSYCVIVTVEGCESLEGCTNVLVNPAPATPIAVNNGPICEGEDITLSTDAVTNATYSWTGPNSFVSTDQNPTITGATTAESGSYCVIVTVDGCESMEGCTEVLVNPTPATPIATNNGPICEGEDINLMTDAVTNATYSWTGPNSFVSTDQNPMITGVTTAESGSYCVIVTVDGCESMEGCTEVLVNPTPATPIAMNNGPICEGEDINLTTDAITDATYSWTGPNSFASTDQNPTITGATPSESGSYCVVITVDGCESMEGCTEVLVNPAPATPVATNNGPICEGEDITLMTDAVTDATYSWTGPNSFVSTDQNPTITGATTAESGSYCVIITVDGCESLEGCTEVLVNPTPATPVATNNGPICEGEDINLMTDAVTDATYAWTGPNSFVSTDQNPTIAGATTAESGSYCVIVTVDGCESLGGCTEVMVNPTPATPVATNNGPICEGEDITLMTDAVTDATYAWTGPNSFVSTDQNPTITGATTAESGSYCVIVTVDGCESLEGCTEVMVNPTPATPVATNNGPICEGEDITLMTDAVTDATYSWTGPNSFVSTDQNPTITGATTAESGSYCVIVTVDGCESLEGCTEVLVNPTPATPVATNNGPICEGEDITLMTDAVTDATYAWTGPNSFVSTDQNPTITGVTTAESGSYCVIITVDGCVSMEGCTEVLINPTPTTPIAMNNGPICEGEDITLMTDAVTDATYAWTGPNSFVSTDQNPTITGATSAESGSYCVIVTVDGCESLEGCTEVLVNPTPATPVATNNGPICEGEDITLMTDAVTDATYAWTGPNSFVSTDQNPTITGATTAESGSYCVIITVAGCESLEGCTEVLVNPTPATPTANNNGPICEGEDINLTTDAVADATYAWTGPNSFVSTDQNPTITGATTAESGSYCVIITVAGCESLEGCTEVLVNPTPATPTANNNGPICEGEDINLTTDVVTDATYSWTGPNSFVSTDQNPTITGATTAESGSYCVIITLAGCVSLEGCTEVLVNPTPATPIATNNGPICQGENINLTTDALTDATYSWTGPNSFVSTDQNPTITGATTAESGSYCVIIAVAGCESLEGCTEVLVNPTPATPIATNNGPICEGENINLTTDAITDATYSWTGPNSFVSTEQNPTIIGATTGQSGNYCVVVTVEGCESFEGCTNVIINETPTTPIATNNGPICEGENLALTTDAVANATYSWTGPNSFVSTDQNPLIVGATPAESGNYCVVVTVEGCVSFEGCTNVLINAIPTTPIATNNGPICEGENIALSTDAVADATYSWTGPNSFVSTDQNPSIIGATSGMSGNYCVVVTVEGCESFEGCTNVIVNETPDTPLAADNGPICEGENLALTTDAVTNATYSWTGPNSFTSTDQNPFLIGATPGMSGNYCVVITVEGCISFEGCTNVLINATPTTPIATNNGPICEGENIALSTDAVANATYLWIGPNSFTSTDQNPNIIGATASESGSYCVTITVEGCESLEGCTEVLVNPTPTTPTANDNGPICEGQDINLTTDAVADATYSWTGPNSFTSTDQNPSIIGATPGMSGNYCVVISVDGCTSFEGCTNVMVNPTPTTPTATNNGPICEGENIALSTDAVTGATYSWTGPNSFTSTEQNPTIIGATAGQSGNYCVVISLNGCTSLEGCTNVVVNPTPVTPLALSNGPICEGEDINLTTDEVTNATYSWSGPNSFTSTDQNPNIIGATASESGSYCVVITVDGCESQEGCINVLVNPTPSTPQASNNGPICEGESIELATDAVAGAIYSWTGPNSFTSNLQNPTVANASTDASGSYCVVIILDDCESLEGCTEVLVNPTPAIPVATNNGPICEGEDINLMTDVVTNATYAWTGPNSFVSTDQNPVISGATASENGSYCVVVTVDGCESLEGCTEVLVNPTPATPIASNSGPYCEGADVTLFATTIADATYSWTGPNSFVSTDQNPVISGATTSTSGDYCVVVTVNGCESLEGCTEVLVNPTPASPIATNNGPICEGEDINLMTDEVTDATYAWTGPNSFVSIDQNPTISGATATESGSYCVVITVDGCESLEGCTEVLVNPTPATPIAINNGPVCEGEDLNLTTDAVADATYSWSGPNSFVSNEQSPILTGTTPNMSGTYCLVITIDGCESMEDCTIVEVSPEIDAGSDQSRLCEVLTDIEINMSATAATNGTWSTGTNPASVSFSDINSENCIISNFTLAGTYTFIWSNGICSDEIVVEVSEMPNAGPDQSVKCNLTGSVIMAAEGAGIWTLGTVDGTVTIVNDEDPNTVVTDFENKGTYELIWTIGDCTDRIIITVDDDCDCPIVDNLIDGSPEDYCGMSEARLIEGQEATPAGGTYQWQYSINGADFTDLASTNTKDYTTLELGLGTHEFRRIYSIDSPECSDTSNQVIMNVLDQPMAGDDQDILCADLSTLEIQMSGTGTGVWNLVSGGSATIEMNDDPNTIITNVTAPGTYVFSYGSTECIDEVTINITEAAEAGPDQSVNCFATGSAVMSAVSNSNGIWSWNSTLPNQPTFDFNDANAVISGFEQAGTYELIWTVGDCSDNVFITVGDNCNCPIENNIIDQPDPTQYCGVSPEIEITGSAATPDGEYTWIYSVDSGSFGSAPGVNDQQNYTTQALSVGTHRFRRIYETTSIPICMDTSNIVEITVLDQPDAGQDQTLDCIDLPGGSIMMNGTGAGSWTALGTNSGSNIVDGSLLNTEINGFTASGTYGYVLGNGICSDTVYVEVTESVEAGGDQMVDCFVTGSATMAAMATNGTWSIGNVPTGAGDPIIVSPTSPNTSVTNFDLSGTYQLIWTNNVSNCSDVVDIIVGEDCACPISGNDIIQPVPSEYCDLSPMILIQGADATPIDGSYAWEYSFNDENSYVSATGINDAKDYTTAELAVGEHRFRRIFSIDMPMCSDTSNVILITVIESPDAGQDQTLECIDLPGSTIMAATGTGVWTENSGNPSSVTIVTPNSPTSTIEGLTSAGDYFFTYTNGNCSDEVMVTVSSAADAGSDQTVNCFLTGTASLSATGTGVWSYADTPNDDEPIFNTTSANTTISGFAGPGTYELVWTSNGCMDVIFITVGDNCNCPIADNVITQPSPAEFCFESDDITIVGLDAAPVGGTYTWEVSTDGVNFATSGVFDQKDYNTGTLQVGEYTFRRIYDLDSPVCSDTSNIVSITVLAQPDAGIDQTLDCVSLPTSVVMAGTGSGTWTSNTGNPPSANILTSSSATTEITGLVSGVYFFTFNNGICSDEVMITVTEQSDAGVDQTFDCFETATAVLNASGNGTWTWGPTQPGNTPTIDNVNPNATVTGFEAAGDWILIWTNEDGCTDEVTLTVGSECNCPIINNIIDQQVPSEFCGVQDALTITGMEASPLNGTYRWEHSYEMGPWNLANGVNDAKDYTTTLLAVGEHRFRRFYIVIDPIDCEDISNIVTINVVEEADAGPDQAVDCFEDGVATMAATSNGTWTWSSTNTATIVDPTNPNTEVTDFPAAGTYTLIWTTDDGGCTDAVDIVVGSECNCPIDNNTITQPDPFEFCITSDAVTIIGSDVTPSGGLYAWEYSFNGGAYNPAGLINDQRDYTTDNLGVGEHRFRRVYTVTSPIACEDVSDEVLIIVYEGAEAGVDQNVDCFEDGVATMAASGNGTWTWSSTNTADIVDATDANTEITDFPAAGTYTLIWTTDDGGCTDEVDIVVGAICNCPIENNTITQPDPFEFCITSDALTIIGSDATPVGGSYFWEYSFNGEAYNPAGLTNDQRDYTTDILGVGEHRFRRVYSVSSPIACEDISDEVLITVYEGAQAGPDQDVNCFEDGVATMAASGNGTWTWSSANTANIVDATDANTEITDFPAAGTYTLIWTTDDGGCTDEVDIVVGAICNCPIENNTITQPDPFEFCVTSDAVTIIGSDATPSGGSYLWEYSFNGGAYNPADLTNDQRDYTTDILGVGEHRFRRVYSVTSPIACDDVSNVVLITVYEEAQAGLDQTVDCFEDGVATMAASGSGTWTWSSANTANIVDATDANTEITDFPAAGTYTLIWTTDDGGCTDEVDIVVGAICNCPIENNTITQPDPFEFCVTSDAVTIIGSDATPSGGSYLWEYSFNGGAYNPAGMTNDQRDYTTDILGVGEHRFRRVYSVTSPIDCEDMSDEVLITVYEGAQAGPDQNVNCFEDGVATMAASGNGTWTWSSANIANIVDATDANTEITNFPAAGTYTLIWTTEDGGCTDEVDIVVGAICNCPIENNTITQPDPFEFCVTSDAVTIIGSDATPAGGSYFWEYSFNGGAYNPSDLTNDQRDYTTDILGVGEHRFRRVYSVTSPIACDDVSNVVLITVYEEAQAGLDQTVDCFEDGVATMAASGNGTWTWSSANTANIVDATDANTEITDFPAAGTYTLIWTTDDGGCTDEVDVIVGDDCNCTIENNSIIQPDPNEFCGEISALTIFGSDAIPANGTYRWEYSFNNGTFVSANGVFDERDYTTEILGVGEHRFRRMYAVTAPIECSDISNVVTIIIHEEADAGPNQTVDCFEDGVATLAAIGEGSWSWSSTMTATIDMENVANSTISNFPEAGTYELIWTTDDGCTDAVIIEVGDDCFECEIMNNDIEQPIPSDYCEVSPEMTIVGGAALPASGVYTWEYSFNGGAFVEAIGSENQPSYTTSDLGPGEHRFRRRYLLQLNPICEDISNAIVINVEEPVDAGLNQNLGCVDIDNVVVAMSANGTGQWIQSTSNPSQITFSDENDSNTELTGFGAAGMYTFVWSNGMCEDEMTVMLEESSNAGEDRTIDCFVDGQTTLNASGAGTWSFGSNNPGVVVISSVDDPNATLSNFLIDGVYELIWTVDGCEDIVLVVVGQACPCLIESNVVTDNIDDVFCQTTGQLMIIGEEALPAGGSYLWQMSIDGSGFSNAPGTNNTKDYDASNLGEGTYILRREYRLSVDGIECNDISEEIEFFVYDDKEAPGQIFYTPDPVCVGDSLILEVDFNSELTYNWQIMSGVGRVLYSLDSMSMIVVESPGTITVSVTQSLEGCNNNIQSTSSEIDITVLDNPKPNLGRDTTFCELDETFTMKPGDFVSYEWQDGSTAEEFEVEGEGIYTVSVVDTMGCVGTDMVNIKSFCCEFAYPNIFRADSRGKNAIFNVTDIYDCVIEAELFIYDRWGNLVFVGDELDHWDGTFKGKFVEQGVYVFIYKYKAMDADRQEFEDEVSGDITVLR